MGKKKRGRQGMSNRKKSGTRKSETEESAATTASRKQRAKKPADAGPRAIESDPFPIVGLGASAGGLAALKTFFSQVPEDSGLAFVVVVHLSPEHKSHLAELLQPHVKIPVQQVLETVKLEPNRVYVIPPGANLDTIDTHLRLTELEQRREERTPIDHFFRTLARTHDGEAIGVILTGTGSDGTLGIREIKEGGGTCVVQDPAEAEYDGMPQSAVATGIVDLVLPLAKIPQAILDIVRTRPRVPQIKDGEEPAGEARQLLHKLFAQIRVRTGRDFGRYKQSTIVRRVQRRMQIQQIEELGKYLELLREHPDEVRTLADDLLITVTSFFRDPEVFEKLQRDAIGALFENKRADDEIRVWSVGCATGEEAYSLAILLREEAARQNVHPRIQVFASDMHEHSLQKAREGFFPGDIETDVSPERLQRFFLKENGGYRIRKELREMVVFAPHNLLSDPPFSRLDLISCRNLLIYIQRKSQRDIIELFHYALNADGYLLLGTSETLDAGDLFRLEDKKCCLYRKRNIAGPEPRLPVFPVTHPTRVRGDGERPERAGKPLAYGVLHQRMIEQHAPPSALVSPDNKIVHLSEHAGRYLLNQGGEPTVNIFKLVRKELQIDLRTVLHVARREKAPVSSNPIPVRFNGDYGLVTLRVRPALEPLEDGFALIIFEEHPTQESQALLSPPVPDGITADQHRNSSDAIVQELQSELEQTRQRLQAIIEEYETSQEEMKASNEEMQSTNEELRSTLEEPETSKEELQSMNEELQAANQENRHKVDELSQLSDDLQNLLGATDIATLFLDRDLRILRFTSKVTELLNVRSTDRGRPLTDLTHHLGYDQLHADATRVLEKLIPIEREVQDKTERWHLTRLLPYRSGDDRIEGVVITFVEITSRKQAEEELRRSQESLANELSDTQRLQAAAGRLLTQSDLDALLQELLQTAVDLAGADMGDMQLLDEASQMLRMGAQIGFRPDFLRYLATVTANNHSCCWHALASGKRIVVADVSSSDLYSGASRQVMLDAGARAVQSTPLITRSGRMVGILSTHWRQPYQPSQRQLSLVDVLVRQAADLIERGQQDERLRKLNESLEQQVTKRTEMLKLLQDVTRNANEALTVEAALMTAMERMGRFNSWQVGHAWCLAKDENPLMVSSGIWYLAENSQSLVRQLEKFQQISSRHRFAPGQGLVGRVMESGQPCWIDDIDGFEDWRRGRADDFGLHAAIAFPVTRNRQVVAVLEFFSAHPARRDERFMEILPDIGIQLGHVIRRKELEREIATAIEHEQRRLGSDIHDDVGQELTGMRHLMQSLNECLTNESSPHRQLAVRITEGLESVQKGLRRVIRNLVPVEVDERGLLAALQSLAEHTTEANDVHCRFLCKQPIALEDTLLATHIYRVMQEAVNNAVKHANARQITIQLSENRQGLHFEVADDGIGISAEPSPESGYGLKSMAYRAALLGAGLSIQRGENGGTVVRCTVPRSEVF